MTAIALALLLVPLRAAATPLDFRSADFRILRASTGTPIGKVHYDVSDDTDNVQIVTSDARYTDGQHDVERDELDTRGATPSMLGYEHVFFRADGGQMLSSKADFSSGVGTCTRYDGVKPETSSANFVFPKDTYAGAGITLPLQESLRDGERRPVSLHYFACVPGPKLLKIEVLASAQDRWQYYPGSVVGAEVKPDFGWLNYLIAPFLPEMQAWFSASPDFTLVGGRFSRYYKGPEIIIARDQTNQH